MRPLEALIGVNGGHVDCRPTGVRLEAFVCLGLPMQVASGDEFTAEVVRGERRERVKMLLVGAQPEGTYVLVHLGSAVRVLETDEAEAMNETLAELERSSL